MLVFVSHDFQLGRKFTCDQKKHLTTSLAQG